MTTATVATYEKLLELQRYLVARRMLAPTQVHHIVEANERPQYGSVWLRCSCGDWTSFRADEAEHGEALYVRHATEAVRDTLGRAA